MVKKGTRVDKPEEKAEETGADLFDKETAEAKSLAEIAGTTGGMFEGDLLTMDAIEGRKVYVLDFTLRPSTFRDGSYICLQLKRKDGTMNVLNSTAKVPMKIANVNKETGLPAVTAFVKRPNKTPGQKPYWDMASEEELKKLPWL